MPTTLWSRVYLKYFARPPAGAYSMSRSGLPAISRNRSLKIPIPASQPTVPNTYPRTTGQSLVSLRPWAKLALADCTCRPGQLPMDQPISAPSRPVCTAGFRHQALTSAGPPGSPPAGWIRSAPGVASMAIRSPRQRRTGQCVRRRQRPGAHHGENTSPLSPDWVREGGPVPVGAGDAGHLHQVLAELRDNRRVVRQPVRRQGTQDPDPRLPGLQGPRPDREHGRRHHAAVVEHGPVPEPAQLAAAHGEAPQLLGLGVRDVVHARVGVRLHPELVGPEAVDDVQRGHVELDLLAQRQLKLRGLKAAELREPVGEGPTG